MKAKLMGIQYLDFTADTGEQIVGSKLHVVSDYSESSTSMMGQRVASIFTRLDCSKLKIGGTIDLCYEQSLGSTKSRLVSIANIPG